MLDQIMGLIQDHSKEAIVNNPAIPNEKNEAAMQTILGAITGGLQQQVQSNGISGVLGLLGGQSGGSLMSNPIVAGIAQQAIAGLVQKLGLGNNVASGIVSDILPKVLGSVISKTNDPNDSSFNLQDITGALSDGKLDMGDISSIAGKFLGGGGDKKEEGLGGMLGGLFN